MAFPLRLPMIFYVLLFFAMHALASTALMESTPSHHHMPACIPTPPSPFSLPLGATYKQTMKFPVLGHQAFSIQILSDTTARLMIHGMMTIDEVVAYQVDAAGKLIFALSSSTQRTLRKFKTKLLEAGYDPATDTPYVKVAPYILPALKIRMRRFQDSAESDEQ